MLASLLLVLICYHTLVPWPQGLQTNGGVRWSEGNLRHYFLPNNLLEQLWNHSSFPSLPSTPRSLRSFVIFKLVKIFKIFKLFAKALCETGFPAIGWLWCTDAPKGLNWVNLLICGVWQTHGKYYCATSLQIVVGFGGKLAFQFKIVTHENFIN